MTAPRQGACAAHNRCVILTPRQSAAVACLLDGLNEHQSAAAIGCSPKAFSELARHARRNLGEQRLSIRWIRAKGVPQC